MGARGLLRISLQPHSQGGFLWISCFDYLSCRRWGHFQVFTVSLLFGERIHIGLATLTLRDFPRLDPRVLTEHVVQTPPPFPALTSVCSPHDSPITCVYPLTYFSPSSYDPELDARLSVPLSFSPQVLIGEVGFLPDIL